jgi:hypothetical protein
MVNKDAALLNRHVTRMTPPHFSAADYSVLSSSGRKESLAFFRMSLVTSTPTKFERTDVCCYRFAFIAARERNEHRDHFFSGVCIKRKWASNCWGKPRTKDEICVKYILPFLLRSLRSYAAKKFRLQMTAPRLDESFCA